MEILKTITRMASEFTCTPKTLSKHIRTNERLKTEINTSEVQMPKKQKLIYEEFGYPPSVKKSDYENV
jgi:hypothetical protein